MVLVVVVEDLVEVVAVELLQALLLLPEVLVERAAPDQMVLS
jgi:hypothetical protein